MALTAVRPADQEPRARWSRFSRPIARANYFPEIDGLRFISIALVLVFHVGVVIGLDRGSYTADPPFGTAQPLGSLDGFLARTLDRGSVGVLVFFTISGFVLALPFVERRIKATTGSDLARYFVRRFTRIEPPYVVAMVLLFLVARTMDGSPSLASLAASLGYVHQMVFSIPSPANGSAWSLEVEVQWYVLVPLLSVLLLRGSTLQRRLSLVLLIVGALLFQMEIAAGSPRAFTSVLSWLQFFLVGWLLAEITVTGRKPDPRYGRRWDIVSVIGWPLLIAIAAGPFEAIVAPPLIMMLCAAALRGRATSRILRTPALVAVGTMCYSIYLVHYPVFVVIRRLLGQTPAVPFSIAFIGWGLVLLPITLLASAAFFLCVERPCMDPGWVSKVIAAGRRMGATVPSPPEPEQDLAR
jgi:peptidoglycan/LPS O-acetylase OafA/YrhL